jgi:hypothetical protein
MNFPFLISYLLAAALSTVPGTQIVRTVARWRNRRWHKSVNCPVDDTDYMERWARDVGCIERWIFVYALMNKDFMGLLTAVVIFKAFFNWLVPGARARLRRPTPAAADAAGLQDPTATPHHLGDAANTTSELDYHAYLLGASLSLLVALVFAGIGKLCYAWLVHQGMPTYIFLTNK